MSRKPAVTIVGPGSLGGALALALHSAGYTINEIVYHRDRTRAQTIAQRVRATPVSLEKPEVTGDLAWICVPDTQIARVAAILAGSGGLSNRFVFHSSGALPSDEIKTLGWKGASLASVHPMMSFVRGASANFNGVMFALEGHSIAIKLAAQIATDLGGNSFELKKEDKPLYHALGAFSSPMIIALFAAAERIGKELGLSPEHTRRVIGPILRKTIGNYLDLGSSGALSGPLTRGDVTTVRHNLEALARVPGTPEIYQALSRVAVEDLPVKNQKELAKAINTKKRTRKPKKKKASA